MRSTRIPGDATTGHLAVDFQLRTPLREVHDIWRLVDADHAIGGAGGQLEAEVFGGELDVGDAGPGVDERSPLHPRGGGGFGGGAAVFFAGRNFFPNGSRAVERARGWRKVGVA